MERDNGHQYKIVMFVMASVILILSLTLLSLVDEIGKRQVYTTEKVNLISNNCLK